MAALVDLRGQADLFGRALKITLQAYADLLASAAQLVSGEAAEGAPVILARGLRLPPGDGRASDLYRAPEHDLYG
jgi:coenzyme F420-0:L-glutamate ligase/coenzyme F420-1:gamma-L-glutamate ligase